MIVADHNVDDKEIEAVSNIYNKLTDNKKFSKSQIDKTIKQVKQEGQKVDDYLKEIKSYLNSDHRELIIKAMYFIAAADGNFDDKEGKLLMKTAGVLEMTPAHVKGVLSELDKNKSN